LEHQVRQQPIGAPGVSAEDGKEWNERAAITAVSAEAACLGSRTRSWSADLPQVLKDEVRARIRDAALAVFAADGFAARRWPRSWALRARTASTGATRTDRCALSLLAFRPVLQFAAAPVASGSTLRGCSTS
jgi:hypothetical protein